MTDEWDADDFEPASAVKADDRWEGEDEDEDIKDAWDADSEEDKSKEEGNGGGGEEQQRAVQRKKKKKLFDIKEKEAKRKEEDSKLAAMTEEAKLAEKLRQQKLEENANLQMAKDMMGLKPGSVDALVPVTKEEFEAFHKALSEKITQFASSPHYPDMVESLVKEISLDLSASTIKKIKLNLDALHSTKLKEERAAKAKKGKSKIGSLRMENEKDIFSANAGAAEYDDMDDFM